MHPDENRRHVSPDLGPNCLQRLSANDTGKGRDRRLMAKSKRCNLVKSHFGIL